MFRSRMMATSERPSRSAEVSAIGPWPSCATLSWMFTMSGRPSTSAICRRPASGGVATGARPLLPQFALVVPDGGAAFSAAHRRAPRQERVGALTRRGQRGQLHAVLFLPLQVALGGRAAHVDQPHVEALVP